MPLPGIRCPPNVIARWRARASSTCTPRRRGRRAAHADRLFESLCAHFQDARGGWRYSVDAQARPLDETQDLYTHAFIVFACAAYFRRSRNAAARKLMLGAAETIEARFKRPDGLYEAAVASDWSARCAARPRIP